jgi:hypothetical protein
MADDLKGKMQQAGHKIAETAKEVGHKISEGAEMAADWAKEKAHQAGHRLDEAKQKVTHAAQETFGSSCGTARSTADIREHMDVIGSCGNKLGVVDHVEGNRIKLTKNDSLDGRHHFVPLTWVSQVDNHVHLSKNCGDAKKEWQSA